MTQIQYNHVWFVCQWLRSFLRDTEKSERELEIGYIENLAVEDVNGMMLRDMQRLFPDREYVLERVANLPSTEQLRLVIGSLSTRNGHESNVTVRNLMIAEINRTRPRTGPPGPKECDSVYPSPGARQSRMHLDILLHRLSFLSIK